MTEVSSTPTQGDLAANWLRANPGSHGIKDVADALGLGYQNTAALLSTMNKRRAAVRVGPGTYQAPDEPIVSSVRKTTKPTRKAKKAVARKSAAVKTSNDNVKLGPVVGTMEGVKVGLLTRTFEVVRETGGGQIVRDTDNGGLFFQVPVKMTVDLGAGAVELGRL